MNGGNEHQGVGDRFDFNDNTFHGPFQTEGTQHIHYHTDPRAAPGPGKWWHRRTTGVIAALGLLCAAAGVYAIHALGPAGSAHASTPGAAAGTHTGVFLGGAGTPSGIPVTRPLHPGSATLPSDVQIQAELSTAGCTGVTYYAETADEYQAGQRKGAKRLGPGVIDITSQTSSSESVLLVGMRVLVLQRKAPPAHGIVVQDGQCGGVESVRPFWTDLDKPGSVIIAEADPGGPGDPGHPPVTFPFKISPNDPEVFELTAKDTSCFCTYAIEIDWVVAGKAGKATLNNDGTGFWAGAAPRLPSYKLGPDGSNHLVAASYQQLFP